MRVFLRGKTWYAEFYDRDGNRVIRTTRSRDHKAAVLVARRLEREAADPAPAAATETLVRALNEFLIVSERRMKDGEITRDTHDYNEGRARPLFLGIEAIGDGATVLPRRLGDLAPRHIDAYIDWRRSSNVKPNTIKKELVVLGVALRIAKRRGWWFGDFDALMPEDFKPEYEPGKRWLTQEEVAAVLLSLPAHRAALVAFSVATGARPEEAPRAQKEDVGASRVFLRGTKTDAAPRHVPIVLWWQRALLERVDTDGKGPALRRWPMIRRDLREKADALGIPRFSPRDLRRTFAHWMRQAGVAEDLVAKMLGHKSTKMVKRVYANLGGDEVEALVRAALGCDAGVPTSPYQTDSADRSDSKRPAVSPEKPGSSCWTRTSDPVVNSRSLSGDIPDTSEPVVAPVWSDELLGLSRSARSLSDLWDLLDEAADEEREA